MSLFAHLWKNYPSQTSMATRCRNQQPNGSDNPFENYCAIKMSECLNKSAVKYIAKGTCWSHEGPRHVLLAENLAKSLKSSPPLGFGKCEFINPATFQKILDGRTGVIFFKDYWQRGSESFESRSGDHIDLWKKDRLTDGPMWVRELKEYFGASSDLNQSKEIWFWEVK